MTKQRVLIRVALIVIVAIVAYFQKDQFLNGEPESGSSAPTPAVTATVSAPSTLIKDVRIKDVDGRIAYRGDMDLAPTLARIKAGKRDSHRNDGAVFGNRERRLPQKARGYYREYVVRTPGINHAGPQRLVIGKGGEVYYTHDHYQSFRKISP